MINEYKKENFVKIPRWFFRPYKGRKSRRMFSDKEVKLIIKLRKKYLPNSFISKVMKCSPATITNYIKKLPNLKKYNKQIIINKKNRVYKIITKKKNMRNVEKLIKFLPDIPPKIIKSTLYDWKRKNQQLKIQQLKIYRESITSKKACVLVSCKPSIQLLIEIQKDYPEINLERTKKMIIEIEKKLYSKNLFRSSKTIVACAIYLSNAELTQQRVYEITNTTGTTIRNVIKALDIPKHQKSKPIPKPKPRKFKKKRKSGNTKASKLRKAMDVGIKKSLTKNITNLDNTKLYDSNYRNSFDYFMGFIETIETKKCTKCGQEYPATTEYFYQQTRVKSGIRAWCKKCCTKKTKKEKKAILNLSLEKPLTNEQIEFFKKSVKNRNKSKDREEISFLV